MLKLTSLQQQNSTAVSSFVLAAYVNPGSLRWLFFFALLLLYLLMIFFNLLLLCVIALNRGLHEPMYVFLCSLLVNELYGSAALLPFLLVHILRDVHTVPAALCFLQIYVIHGYGMVEYLMLAVMSYDRYVAICRPLHYRALMSRGKTAALVFFPWVSAVLLKGVMIGLNLSLKRCGNVISKVYCDNFSTVKLACYGTSAMSIYGITEMIFVILSPLIVILYTYVRILKVCWGGERRTRQRAVNTCGPHLASVLNFTVAASFELLQSRFDMSHVPNMLRVFLSLYFLLCPPLFNPLIYGLVLSNVRLNCRDLLRRVLKRGS